MHFPVMERAKATRRQALCVTKVTQGPFRRMA